MAIAEDFMMGPCRIIIDDSCCVTKKEAVKILEGTAKKIQSHICYVERKKAETAKRQEKDISS